MFIEVKHKIGSTTFILTNWVGKTQADFLRLYFPDGKNIYSVRWDPKKTWNEIQEKLVEYGLKEDNSELKKFHKL